MPSKTDKQKRFFGAVMGAKKGKPGASGKAKEVAGQMSKEQIKHYLKKALAKVADAQDAASGILSGGTGGAALGGAALGGAHLVDESLRQRLLAESAKQGVPEIFSNIAHKFGPAVGELAATKPEERAAIAAWKIIRRLKAAPLKTIGIPAAVLGTVGGIKGMAKRPEKQGAVMNRAELNAVYDQGFYAKCAAAGVDANEILKFAEKNMPHFARQDRPKKTKEIYSAMMHGKKEDKAEMKKRYGARAEEVAARTAAKIGG